MCSFLRIYVNVVLHLYRYFFKLMSFPHRGYSLINT